jgi:hypothetical protein
MAAEKALFHPPNHAMRRLARPFVFSRLRLPAWARPSHAIVRYERRHWQASRVWRAAGKLVWGGSLVFLLVPAACALVFTLTSTFQTPAELVLGLGGLFIAGLFVVTALLTALNGLSASILGATLIARERESQTWPFLRLTTLTTREIVLGKLMALYYTLARPVLIITGLRALALLSGVVTLGLAYLVSGLNQAQLTQLVAAYASDLAGNPVNLLPGLLFSVIGVLIGLAAWLLEPLWTVVYNGIIGLAASTLVRSRGAAVAVVFALHFGLTLGVYAPAQQFSLLASAPLIQLPGALTVVVPFAIIVGQALLLLALNGGVLIGALALSLRRAETFSD